MKNKPLAVEIYGNKTGEVRRVFTEILFAIFVLVLATGCGRDAEKKVVQVYAASSLRDAFEELETVFEQEHPNYDVKLTFAGSQVLKHQITKGAPADVFASAHVDHLEELSSRSQPDGIDVFTTNRLVLIVAEGSETANVVSIKDAQNLETFIVGTPESPIGHYTTEVVRAVNALHPNFADTLTERIVSTESNSRLVRAKVSRGHIAGGIVYATDARGLRGVRTIEIPDRFNPQVSYGITVLNTGQNKVGGELWRTLLLSETGAKILETHGFSKHGRQHTRE